MMQSRWGNVLLPHQWVENMKSKVSQVAIPITMILVLCLIAGLVSAKLTLRAGELGPVDSLSATDLIYGYKISFPIHFDQGYQSGGVLTAFESDQSIDAIVNQIQDSDQFDQLSTFVCSETQAILKVKFGDDRQAVYFLRFETDKSLYVLFNMAAHFQQNPLPLDQQVQDNTVEILFPYHLVQSSTFSESMYFYENTAYLTNYSITDFYGFYEDLGIYEIERTEDEMFIKGYSTRLVSKHAPDINQTIVLDFDSQNSTNSFKVKLNSD